MAWTIFSVWLKHLCDNITGDFSILPMKHNPRRFLWHLQTLSAILIDQQWWRKHWLLIKQWSLRLEKCLLLTLVLLILEKERPLWYFMIITLMLLVHTLICTNFGPSRKDLSPYGTYSKLVVYLFGLYGEVIPYISKLNKT